MRIIYKISIGLVGTMSLLLLARHNKKPKSITLIDPDPNDYSDYHFDQVDTKNRNIKEFFDE